MGVYEFHLSYEEVMELMLGQLIDLVNLLNVYSGSAKERHDMTFDEIIALR